jgi:hypothetical protein
MTELECYKSIIAQCFKIEVNLNDTFYWGTSDLGDVEADDIPKIIHIYQQCGPDTLVAYEAIIRGHDPDASMIALWKDKGADFYRAKTLLEPLADKGTIMWERWYNLEEKKIERSLFNGQEIIWKTAPERIWKLRARLTKDKTAYVVQTARLVDGTWAIGSSISNTRDRLLRKYNTKHNIPIKQCEFPGGDATKFCVRCHRLGRWATGDRTGDELDCVWPSVSQ